MQNLIYIIPALGIISLIYTFIQSSWVSKQDAGDARMQKISTAIADGAMAFLKAEYKVLAIFVLLASILLGILSTQNQHSHWLIVVAFVIGAVFSALAGFIGMKIATKANVRTAQAAQTSLAQALKVSFTGGSVMGMGVAGLAVLGISALFIAFFMIFMPEGLNANNRDLLVKTLEVLTGFSLGAESIALFARVGGGIYTKAADVGADLVGKVEAGIPEDDPRNPATIADNVGDNVGDVAGMGADLFGSYVATILATMVLGAEINTINTDNYGGLSTIILPMFIAGLGIVFSIAGTFFVKIKENGDVQKALNLGNWSSVVFTAIASYFAIMYILPAEMSLRGFNFTNIGVFYSVLVGLGVGTLISIITEYYCSMGKKPVMSIINQSSTGAATNIIAGLSVGMMSTALPVIVLAAGIMASYQFAGLCGVAIAAAGMMATTAMQLAIDAFGPIADNAGGIAEMSHLPKEVREKTDILDAVGNTTAATGKGFAIASAALTSLALFAAFMGLAGIDAIDISKSSVLAGLFVGGMIPFVFSALAIASVGKAAMAMVEEVRRQFREIPGILEGEAEPEYEKCVAISTQAAIREMILPGAIALSAPVIVGFILGPEVLGGLLAGVTVSGVLMAIFQSNAGGAWDNAKKSFEKGVLIKGQTYFKGSEPHKASVIGDTVGDPFKDTSGPSMNILIKLMSIVSLVIAPYIAETTMSAKVKTVSSVSVEESQNYGFINQNISNLSGIWILDESHSFVNFSVRHILTDAKGSFSKISGLLVFDSTDMSKSKIKISIDVNTINTNYAGRDEHLRKAEYFDATRCPMIYFNSEQIVATADGYLAKGKLSIKDSVKTVEMPFKFAGVGKAYDGVTDVAAFQGELIIDRNDYGVSSGKPAIGDIVKIDFAIEANPQK